LDKEQNIKIESSKETTKKLIKKLDKYMKNNVLNNNKFICPHYIECKGSHSGIFYTGQLHHIGNNYDIKINNKIFRIMIVGQEYGHKPKNVTLEKRYEMIMSCQDECYFNNRNPHMKGTTSVLRLLFMKKLGTDFESEWIELSNGDKIHIFDAFSLVNFLMCSALKKSEGMAGKSTTVMKNNCCEHFKKTIKIIEPNVIIIQGKNIWKWIEYLFDDIVAIKGSKNLYKAEYNKKSIIIASFTHPSARKYIYNWGLTYNTEYLLKIIKPTIKKIQKIIGII